MKNGKVTMAEVARRAGVAPTTVARVLYANGYVAADKREIIEKALKESGYRPNVVARGLRTNRSSTLGLVSHENPANPFFVRIAQEIQLAALREGMTVLTLNHNGQQEIEKAGVSRFIDQNVDAVIFCSAIDPKSIEMTINANVTVVQVERQISFLGNLALVDPRRGMREAISHLHALGHRNIAFVGARPGVDNSELPIERSVEAGRYEAFKAALEEFDLAVDLDCVALGEYYGPERTPRTQGYILMKGLLATGAQPTAVVTGSDVLAAGALQAIYEAGKRVPDDISVIGFDDSFATFLTPPLTSIAQPVEALGESAIALALHQIENGEDGQTTHVHEARLVVRESTGPCRR